MKTVILAGGYGTRIAEESGVRPKPMVEIGGRPILWHIMKLYSYFGHHEFIICCGYKGHIIKKYLLDYFSTNSDFTIDLSSNNVEIHRRCDEQWCVTLLDTGETTMTGGRMRRAIDFMNGDGTFCCTYGDGVSNVNISELIEFHKAQGTRATLTAVQAPGRFGCFSLGHNQTRIGNFREKPAGDGAWINGGFFVLEPEVYDHVPGDDTVWEQEPLNDLAHAEQLSAFRHGGFWHPMDTLRDKQVLQEMWDSGKAPWKMWN